MSQLSALQTGVSRNNIYRDTSALIESESTRYTEEYEKSCGRRWIFHTPAVRKFNSKKQIVISCAASTWPLYLHTANRWSTLSSEGPAGPLSNSKEPVSGRVVAALVEQGKEFKVDRIQVQLTPKFVCDQTEIAEGLLAAGFSEIPLYTTVVKVESEKQVKKGMRSNFRRYWNKTDGVTYFEKIEQDLLKTMHEVSIENFTRTGHIIDTWEQFSKYGDLVNSGDAILFHLKEGESHAFLLLRILDQNAHFLFACSNIDLLKKHPNERLHCSALKWLLSKGYLYYDVGLVPVDSWRKKLVAKERSLAYFKQGLGGTLYPISIYERGLSHRYRIGMFLFKMFKRLS